MVEFEVLDQFVPSREAWKNDKVDLLWATIDAFPTEAGGDLKQFDPVVLFQADWSRGCLLYTSPSPRDKRQSRMPSSA